MKGCEIRTTRAKQMSLTMNPRNCNLEIRKRLWPKGKLVRKFISRFPRFTRKWYLANTRSSRAASTARSASGCPDKPTIDWKVAGAGVIGTSHEYRGGRYEDAWATAQGQTAGGDPLVAICVCDGAGSAPLGWLGAAVCSQLLVQWLSEHFDAYYDAFLQHDDDEIRWGVTAVLKRALRRLAEKKTVSLESFATTVVALVTTADGRWLCVHVGDGAIVAGRDGDYQVISQPHNGRYSNETFFVTDHDAHEYLRVYANHNLPTFDAFALFTDGPQNCLIKPLTSEVCAGLGQMFTWLDRYSVAAAEQLLQVNLEQVFRQQSADDCTLVLAKKQQVAKLANQDDSPVTYSVTRRQRFSLDQ